MCGVDALRARFGARARVVTAKWSVAEYVAAVRLAPTLHERVGR